MADLDALRALHAKVGGKWEPHPAMDYSIIIKDGYLDLTAVGDNVDESTIRDYIAALHNASPALADMAERSQWRPIESAPRDGTRVLLGRPDDDGGGGVSVCGYWLDELADGVDYMGNDGGFTDVDYQVFQPGRSFGMEAYKHAGSQPTHWMPLPAPPRGAEREEAPTSGAKE